MMIALPYYKYNQTPENDKIVDSIINDMELYGYEYAIDHCCYAPSFIIESLIMYFDYPIKHVEMIEPPEKPFLLIVERLQKSIVYY